jgi:hypothetical protein
MLLSESIMANVELSFKDKEKDILAIKNAIIGLRRHINDRCRCFIIDALGRHKFTMIGQTDVYPEKVYLLDDNHDVLASDKLGTNEELIAKKFIQTIYNSGV